MDNTNKPKQMAFGITSYDYNTAIPINVQTVSREGYVKYGDKNDYPQYIGKLYENCPTLKSIIDGTMDYVMGNAIISTSKKISESTTGTVTSPLEANSEVNDNGDTLQDLIEYAVQDRMIFGGFAIQIIYDKFGNALQYINLDFSRCRVDEEMETVYYSDKWGKNGNKKVIKYPTIKVKGKAKSKVFYYNGKRTRDTYPICPFNAVIKSAETQIEIQSFHFNSIKNEFMPSAIVSFNNGATATQEEKEETTKRIRESFTGSKNASKVMVTYNDSKDNATTVQKLPSNDFDKRYQALAQSSKEDLFIAFRATPNLFGLNTATTGFNSQEYKEAFTLFNRTNIAPIQKEMTRALAKIDINVEIQPFTINFEKPAE